MITVIALASTDVSRDEEENLAIDFPTCCMLQ